MTQVYFHCSNPQGIMLDQCVVVDDLAEARDQATCVVKSLTMSDCPEDWRKWVLHVSDNEGEELFVVPFSFVLGKPH